MRLLDFCLRHISPFPPTRPDPAKTERSEEFQEKNSVFGKQFSSGDGGTRLILKGNCECQIRFDDNHCDRIQVFHRATL